jgi:hypothetical protein
MAKMNLPAHTVSELSYKDDFESALRVVAESDGTLSTVKASELTSSTDANDGNSSSSTTTKRRKETASKAYDETKAAASTLSSRAKEEDAAIMWFSSLPPANLRLAQKNFRSGTPFTLLRFLSPTGLPMRLWILVTVFLPSVALQALLVSAASVRKIQHATAVSKPSS